jgi:hypothetical protein
VTDILDLIDEATAPVCGWCQCRLLGDGPSEYFCDDECQFEWQRLRAEALVGYCEPTDLAVHVGHGPPMYGDPDDVFEVHAVGIPRYHPPTREKP